MAKRIRRSARNAATAIGNFFRWLPRAIKGFFLGMPSSARRVTPWTRTYSGRLALLMMAVVFIFPLLTRSEYYLGILVYANILVIYAASWDLLAGYAGQSSFGHATFLGMAGYITSALVRYYGQTWWISMLAGASIAVLLGLVIGIPCLRLRGPYFALGTLAFSLILVELFRSATLDPWLGGSEGVSGVAPLSYDPMIEYAVVLILMIVSLVAMISIGRSRVGTVFKSIRDDEISAEAAGINTTKYKLVAFMLSAFFAGIAGSLFALHFRGVSPELYSTLYSFYAIVMATLGGIATISGSMFGAYFFVVLSELFRGFADLSLLLFAIALLVVLRFASGGIMKPIVARIKDFYDILRGK